MSKHYPPGPDAPDQTKVVSLFDHHGRNKLPQGIEGDLNESPDGYQYFTVRYENSENGGARSGRHEEESAIDVGLKKHYLFKFVEHHKDHSRVDTFYISGEQLEGFIRTIDIRPGKLVEIKQYIPDGMA